jgi:hypothetical protein
VPAPLRDGFIHQHSCICGHGFKATLKAGAYVPLLFFYHYLSNNQLPDHFQPNIVKSRVKYRQAYSFSFVGFYFCDLPITGMADETLKPEFPPKPESSSSKVHEGLSYEHEEEVGHGQLASPVRSVLLYGRRFTAALLVYVSPNHHDLTMTMAILIA